MVGRRVEHVFQDEDEPDITETYNFLLELQLKSSDTDLEKTLIQEHSMTYKKTVTQKLIARMNPKRRLNILSWKITMTAALRLLKTRLQA